MRGSRQLWEFWAKSGTWTGLDLAGTEDGILMYHSIGESFGNPSSRHVSVEQFRRQLQMIATESAVVVPFEELVTTVAPEQKRLALTFDDGYKNFLTKALPVLQRYEMPVTLFVIPEKVGAMWKQPAYDRPSEMLNWDDLHRLVADPLVQIGNHSRTHASLPSLNRDELDQEINQGMAEIESKLGTDVNTFCYPGGKHSALVRDVVGEQHDHAVTVRPDLNPSQTDPLRLPRINGGRPNAVVMWELSDYGNKVRRVLESLIR